MGFAHPCRARRDLKKHTQKRRNLLLTDDFIFITFSSSTALRLRDAPMNKYLIFIVRAVFSAVFAIVLSKFFRPDAPPAFIAGLGFFLLAASYGIEFFRKKKTEN